jgi:hypothetical protein
MGVSSMTSTRRIKLSSLETSSCGLRKSSKLRKARRGRSGL